MANLNQVERGELRVENDFTNSGSFRKNNSQLSTLNSQLILVVTLLLTSCSDYERENFRMMVGEKYALKRWPDSAHIDTLDRFFANEPVRHPERQKAEITMNMSGKIKRSEKSADVPAKKSQRPSAPRAEEKSTESFSERFFYALHKLSENPNNRKYGKKYSAKSGESLNDLLIRIYGSQAREIPRYVSESMLRPLNSSLDLSSLAEGDMVLLPVTSN
ncbi:MAG: hypothetical protein LBU89_13835 [Fibromonadaceae bacterium]|jgi:hypothetical protein|nr:hypothetical protein [Fibromonadaceae bacterium]